MQGTRHRELLQIEGFDLRPNQERSLAKVPRIYSKGTYYPPKTGKEDSLEEASPTSLENVT
ncbi:hypothetical protein A2U01_0060811 [Trifolium medium]|uniref:Uncharacterized protein n=1 Tax=Trifolium medium TaxID=97028 RepID=A0A392RT89_9FABA|nr:hypothetical protein [Trifolium medium]